MNADDAPKLANVILQSSLLSTPSSKLMADRFNITSLDVSVYHIWSYMYHPPAMNITESPLGSLPANFTEAESDTSMIIRCGRWQVTTSTACGGVGGNETRRNVPVPTLLTVSTVPMPHAHSVEIHGNTNARLWTAWTCRRSISYICNCNYTQKVTTAWERDSVFSDWSRLLRRVTSSPLWLAGSVGAISRVMYIGVAISATEASMCSLPRITVNLQ